MLKHQERISYLLCVFHWNNSPIRCNFIFRRSFISFEALANPSGRWEYNKNDSYWFTAILQCVKNHILYFWWEALDLCSCVEVLAARQSEIKMLSSPKPSWGHQTENETDTDWEVGVKGRWLQGSAIVNHSSHYSPSPCGTGHAESCIPPETGRNS